MRSLTVRLDDSYCTITVANHRLITIIRFVVKSYTHPWKSFTNKLRLVLHACEILFSEIVCYDMIGKTKQGLGVSTDACSFLCKLDAKFFCRDEVYISACPFFHDMLLLPCKLDAWLGAPCVTSYIDMVEPCIGMPGSDPIWSDPRRTESAVATEHHFALCFYLLFRHIVSI